VEYEIRCRIKRRKGQPTLGGATESIVFRCIQEHMSEHLDRQMRTFMTLFPEYEADALRIVEITPDHPDLGDRLRTAFDPR
jgi:hypothetical protein